MTRTHLAPRAAALLALLTLPSFGQGAQALPPDDSRAVHLRRLRPPEPAERIDWAARITDLLKEEPGDLVVTAVGDMIFNQPITHLKDPERAGLFRIMQEADVAYGNLEFSLNDRPDLQRPFYNFRAPREFRWEVARTGINLVSLANNHALDFGPEGLLECLKALDHANITYAGAGPTLAAAHAPGRTELAGHKSSAALLSYLRYWTSKYRSKDSGAPSLATIDPAAILVARDGKAEKVEGPLASDVGVMEDDILLARRKSDLLLVALHNHDVTHHRAYGIQDRTPPNEELMYRRALEAGADMVIGTGPHVLRGIELHQGKPIFYSLGDFIYQYRTPERIPADVIHQRDIEMAKVPNTSVWDRRDSQEVMETVMVRMVHHQGKLKRIQLLPITIDDEGPLYGVPRLASTRRGAEILERLRKLSEPYGTRIVTKGWYGEVQL
ncbi:MAG: CapA family protein [Acidobacteria bacterium]|nr:CapA family protein [Acidobacteriota bacterium]